MSNGSCHQPTSLCCFSSKSFLLAKIDSANHLGPKSKDIFPKSGMVFPNCDNPAPIILADVNAPVGAIVAVSGIDDLAETLYGSGIISSLGLMKSSNLVLGGVHLTGGLYGLTSPNQSGVVIISP